MKGSKEYCGICCDFIDEDIITTPCGHSYHNKCLTIWLLNKSTCPLCRKDYDIDDTTKTESSRLSEDLRKIYKENIITEGCEYVKNQNFLRDKISASVREIINYYLFKDQLRKYKWTKESSVDNMFKLFLKTKNQNYSLSVLIEVQNTNITVTSENAIIPVNIYVYIVELNKITHNLKILQNVKKRIKMSQNEPKRIKI